jgi:hypothetical protein
VANPSPANEVFLASAARTTTQTQADQTNYPGYTGIRVVVDTTAFVAGSVTVQIQAKDEVSGKYHTLLTGAAIVSVSTNVYTIFPGAPATANVSANTQLGPKWRILATANNANTQTYSIGYELLP